MSDEVILATAFSQVFKSMHFLETTREWERLPATSKTWVAWQVKYREAHIKQKRLLQANLGGFGGAANSVSEAAIGHYFANMANAAANAATIAAANAAIFAAANVATADGATTNDSLVATLQA